MLQQVLTCSLHYGGVVVDIWLAAKHVSLLQGHKDGIISYMEYLHLNIMLLGHEIIFESHFNCVDDDDDDNRMVSVN